MVLTQSSKGALHDVLGPELEPIGPFPHDARKQLALLRRVHLMMMERSNDRRQGAGVPSQLADR